MELRRRLARRQSTDSEEEYTFMALVSAVIPTLNRPDLLVRAVRSALNQTYMPLEVVVVVDGPDPVTVTTLEAMNEPRVTIIPLENNVGLAEARNIGARKCRGDWIAYLDDDDEWLPEKIAKQVQVSKGMASDLVLVATQFQVKGTWREPDPILPIRGPLHGENVSNYMFRTNGLHQPLIGPQGSGYFASKTTFLRIPFKRGLKYYEDWEWLLRGTSRGMRFILLKEPLYLLHTDHNHPRESRTTNTRWQLSLNWLNSVKDGITREAYASFIVFDTMYHCAETWRRIPIFLYLTFKLLRNGRCTPGHLLGTLKWFLLHPSLRDRLRAHFAKRKRSDSTGLSQLTSAS